MPPANVFTCRRCGQCCQGKGGIVLAGRDVERLCRHLDLDRRTLLSRYTEDGGDMPRVQSSRNGFCIFYTDGCGVYEARPDVCQAWPFFRANLLDPTSFAMARQGCPGINSTIAHGTFVRQGMAVLTSQGLIRTGDDVPRALLGWQPAHMTGRDHGRSNLDAA